MTREVELLCLANSRKYGGRCVAGIDLDSGEWIRPISDRKHGELRADQYVTDRAHDPTPLDIIRITVREHVPDPHQPENWLLADDDWKRLHDEPNDTAVEELTAAITAGPELFGDTRGSIGYEQLEQSPVEESLTLVRPDSATFYREEFDSPARLQFEISGEPYDLAVTDPEWRTEVPKKHTSVKRYLEDHEDVLLTISLGEEYEQTGCCHKLVAAIIPVDSTRLK